MLQSFIVAADVSQEKVVICTALQLCSIGGRALVVATLRAEKIEGGRGRGKTGRSNRLGGKDGRATLGVRLRERGSRDSWCNPGAE